MIIRRMADAIRTQNWFTVVIELVIVVSGILIAVQIDAWNQSRNDQSLEAVYLDRLHDDITASITRNETGRLFLKGRCAI